MNEEQTSIWKDIEDKEKNRQFRASFRKVLIGRFLLAFIGWMSLAMFVVFHLYYYTEPDYSLLIFAIIYLVSHHFSKKKPYACLLIGTVVYCLSLPLSFYTTFSAGVSPFAEGTFAGTFFIGVAIRLLITVFLVRGVIAAKKYETLLKN